MARWERAMPVRRTAPKGRDAWESARQRRVSSGNGGEDSAAMGMGGKVEQKCLGLKPRFENTRSCVSGLPRAGLVATSRARFGRG